jgi:SAM-dependent methyltransferase
MATTTSHKAALADFLSRNPFLDPLTLGLFYREKMRAIHRVAPDTPLGRILEIGGGRSGLTALLYPSARVINLDSDPSHAAQSANRQDAMGFICGTATALPFADHSFDAVTLFDVIEHIDDDARAAAEVERVVKPGGYVLLTTPSERWRYPHYSFMRPICPDEADVLAEWGHVRSGYSVKQLEDLFGPEFVDRAGFINRITVVNHDLAFSRLPHRIRKMISLLLGLPTWCGYLFGAGSLTGNEIALAWRAPNGGAPGLGAGA